MRLSFTIAILIVCLPHLAAAKGTTQIGGWFVSTEKDAFSDEIKALAITPDQDKEYIFGVRCLSKQPSLLVFPAPDTDSPFIKDAIYEVKLRADKGEVVSLTGIGLDKGVEIELNSDIFSKIEQSGLFAVRLQTSKSDMTTDLVFSPTSTKSALSAVKSACGL